MSLLEFIAQVLRFGVVGLSATLIHVAVFLLLTGVQFSEGSRLDPQVANLLAWMSAFVVSFLGHYHWTFAGLQDPGSRSTYQTLLRFLVVSLLGLGLNSGLVLLVVDVLGRPPVVAAVFMATLTPAVSFVISRYWAFRGGAGKDVPAG